MLLDAFNLINQENKTLDDICSIIETDDVTEHRLEYHNWYHYDKELTIDQYKNYRGIKDKTKGVIVRSEDDNSIPWSIQEALENIGERFHWG